MKHFQIILSQNYFKSESIAFSQTLLDLKDLISAKQNKNGKLVNKINNGLIDLRKGINRKEIPEKENPKKVADIVEKTLEFHKGQKGKGIKILTPKQMLQRLPIVLAQVRAGNTSENLSNETRQIIYSLYQDQEVTKKVYNNIMNLIKL